jgi:gas vesicle protein
MNEHEHKCNHDCKHEHKNHAGKIIKAGIFGVIVGAIAGIFLSPKSGKQNQADLKKWMSDTQAEIYNRAKEAQDITQEKFDEIVDQVAQKREAIKDIKEEEWDSFVKDMKKHWNRVKNTWEE